MKNTVLFIEPYWYEDTWIFDDDFARLEAEPFVLGIPEMIDYLVQDISNAREGFRLSFSDFPFLDYQLELEWIKEEDGGNWYRLCETAQEGWLCPALFSYFDAAPSKLYVKAERLPRMTKRSIRDWESTRCLKEYTPTNDEIRKMVFSVIDDVEKTKDCQDTETIYVATHNIILKIAETAAKAKGIAFKDAPEELIIESMDFSLHLDKETIESFLEFHQKYEKILNNEWPSSYRGAMKWYQFSRIVFDDFLIWIQREYPELAKEQYLKESTFLHSLGRYEDYLRERLVIHGKKGEEYVVFKNILGEEEQYRIGLVKGRILLALMTPGDELWYFRSPERSWQSHMGREGIAIVRDGTVLDHIMIRMN